MVMAATSGGGGAASNSGGDDGGGISVEEDVNWLKNNNEPWSEVILKWNKNSQYRHGKDYESITTFMNEWQLLYLPKAIELIDEDFKNLYPGKEKEFENKWQKFFYKLIELKKSEIRTDDCKEKLLTSLSSMTDDEHKIPSQLSLMIHLVPPKGRSSQKKKFSIQECMDSLIIIVENPGDLTKTIEDQKIKAKKFPVQPYIILLGSLQDVKQLYLVIDEISISVTEEHIGQANIDDNRQHRNQSREIDDIELVRNSETRSNTFKDILRTYIDSFVSKLYDTLNMSRAHTQEVIIAAKQLLTDVFLKLKELNIEGPFDSTVTDDVMSCFSHIDSEYKRLKYFKDCNKYVKPTLAFIGSTQEKSKKNVDTVMTLKENFVCMISLKQNLKLFLEIPEVYDKIRAYQIKLFEEKDILRNVVQGKLWRHRHTNNSDPYIPLVLFFDDLETGNPLGSRAGYNKIGAVYVSIASIPPEYASRLENVFLAMLFYSNHRTKFGNESVFDSLIKELNYLHDYGVDIILNSRQIKVKFALCVIAGDNLGLHSILGFNESFSSTNYCRFCYSTKRECQSQIFCDESRKRSKNQYDDDVLQNCGIKETCVWNNISGFHVYDNVYCDVMHDLCEGVLRYGMALIINDLIRSEHFTLEQLNERIKYFDFKSSNSPPQVNKNKLEQGVLIVSASEMLCLVRNFQFLVADLVPYDDKVWDYYLCLLELTNVLMSQVYSEELLDYLKILISEHHEKYMHGNKNQCQSGRRRGRGRGSRGSVRASNSNSDPASPGPSVPNPPGLSAPRRRARTRGGIHPFRPHLINSY
ncbi:unnamed protein product [Diatraea saccharalis]|uniref:Uncharacterized protein n=1 Tax=Diatraea saccharalis TaxID=40085 RepID=A0A9N9QTG1_9NEOP|nr:unnamed protein product [Diatraea saccharalis]